MGRGDRPKDSIAAPCAHSAAALPDEKRMRFAQPRQLPAQRASAPAGSSSVPTGPSARPIGPSAQAIWDREQAIWDREQAIWDREQARPPGSPRSARAGRVELNAFERASAPRRIRA